MNSTLKLVRFLGLHGTVSVRRDLYPLSIGASRRLGDDFGQSTSALTLDDVLSLIETIATIKVYEIFKSLMPVIDDLTRVDPSTFWADFQSNVKKTTADQGYAALSDIAIIVDEFSVTETTDLTSLDEIIDTLLSTQRAYAKGKIVLDVEGVVSWPAPDPDLEFNWLTAVHLVESCTKILVSIVVLFDHVQGPGLGWILGVGLLLGGTGLAGLGTGFAVGEFIDLQYDNPDTDAKIVGLFASAFKGSQDVLVEGVKITLSRPVERGFQLVFQLDLPQSVSSLFQRILH